MHEVLNSLPFDLAAALIIRLQVKLHRNIPKTSALSELPLLLLSVYTTQLHHAVVPQISIEMQSYQNLHCFCAQNIFLANSMTDIQLHSTIENFPQFCSAAGHDQNNIWSLTNAALWSSGMPFPASHSSAQPIPALVTSTARHPMFRLYKIEVTSCTMQKPRSYVQ